jgi:hypothetical protein
VEEDEEGEIKRVLIRRTRGIGLRDVEVGNTRGSRERAVVEGARVRRHRGYP